MKLLTFEQALDQSSHAKARHLLTGNGFSIACRPNIFLYKKLFEQADFTKLSKAAREVFTALNTQDFEKVIKALRDSAIVWPVYSKTGSKTVNKLISDADGLRELLVQTIAKNHPERPHDISESEFAHCKIFLSNFDKKYTLNYDLLLYWTLMHNDPGVEPTSDDGFRKPEDDPESAYVTWEGYNSNSQNVWFLHGALHLFDAGYEIQKYTWVNTGIALIDQIRDALNSNKFPLFVAEGTSKEKIERIRHNDYLARGLRSFNQISGPLFIYGHSLAENDEHILKAIERGRLNQVYVGVYGDQNSAVNQAIISRANKLNYAGRKKALDVHFFDAESAKVWG